MSSLGEKIKLYRQKSGLKQEDVAMLLGKSKNVISNWERGDNKPDADTIEKLCFIFNVSPNILLNWTSTDSNDIISYEITQDEKEHLQKYRFIDEYGQSAVNAVLEIEFDRCEAIAKKTQAKQKKAKKKEIEEEYKEPAQRSLPDGVVLLSDYREEDKCDDNMVSMPIYDLGASAGTGVLLDSNYYEVAAMPDTPKTRKANFAVWVNGHSMEPEFNDGDLVLVRTQPAVDIGEIGIFIVNGDSFIKKQGEDRLISLNPDYDDIIINEWDEVYCKGKVLDKL